MKKVLKISVKHPEIICILISGGEEIDSEKWTDDNNTSVELFARIERILERNDLKISDLDSIETSSDQGSYTASRIIRTVARTINFCLKK